MKWIGIIWICLLTACSLLCPECPPCTEVPMAETADIAVIDGEDAGTTPWEWDNLAEEGGCTFALDAGAANHGSYGYKFTGDGSNNYAYGYVTFAGQTELYFRYYIYIPSTFNHSEGTDYAYVGYMQDGAAGKVIAGFQCTPNPAAWALWYSGGVFSTSATNFSVDEWHRVEIRFYAGSGADGVVQCWIDGDLVFDHTGLNFAGVEIDKVLAGQMDTTLLPDNGDYFYLDDILFSTTGPIGAYAGGALPGGSGNMRATFLGRGHR